MCSSDDAGDAAVRQTGREARRVSSEGIMGWGGSRGLLQDMPLGMRVPWGSRR